MITDPTLSLGELRESRGDTQAELAGKMRIDQANVSRIESRDDVRVSTLRDYIGALGGELEIRARFANEVVRVEPGTRVARRLADLRSPIREWISPIVDRLVRDFQPVRIAVFGSHARGTATPDSDLDLLVVLRQVRDRREAAIEVRRSLRDIPVPKDIVVVSSDQATQRSFAAGTAVREALDEGVTVYSA